MLDNFELNGRLCLIVRLQLVNRSGGGGREEEYGPNCEIFEIYQEQKNMAKKSRERPAIKKFNPNKIMSTISIFETEIQQDFKRNKKQS